MSSDYFRLNFINSCDDDGVYYIRQLGPDDNVGDFEGIVWFGQLLQNEPSFANVFMGRLRLGIDTDELGNRVDRWEGRFIDIPKGRACGAAELAIKSLVIPIDPRGLGLPSYYLIRDNPAPFGGRVWPFPLAPNWQFAFERGLAPFEAPAIPPRLSYAYTGDLSILDDSAQLTSNPVPAGFERSGDDLTGTWRGNDGGSYYVTQVLGSNEVAWYAEHPTARPQVSTRFSREPAQGWANVFFGERTGRNIQGMWADIPRGSENSAGHLELEVISPRLLHIVRATGGYGGTTLWKVKTRKLTVTVESLAVHRGEEDLDDPLLYLVFFKIDGETANLDDLRSSSGTVESRPEVHLGPDIIGTVLVPPDSGRWATTLSTLRSDSGADVESATRIGVIAYAFEVDSGYSSEFRERRFTGWGSTQEHAINSALHRGELPSLEYLRSTANRMLVRYLGPWEGSPWGDPDDILSGDVAMVSFADLISDSRIEHTLNFAGSGAIYSANVIFEAESRLNTDCSS